MIIGLDLDDVLFQANESLARFHNGRYGTSYDRHMVRSWDFEELWGCTTEEVIRRIGEWYDTHEHHTSNPVTGAVDALSQLAEQHTLFIVTARSPNVQQTMAWVKRHLPQVFNGIHFTNHAQSDLLQGPWCPTVCRRRATSRMTSHSQVSLFSCSTLLGIKK
jgi:5'(3')-deoxyribonucleotidase